KVGQVNAVHEIHHEIMDAISLTGVAGADDVRVVELTDGSHLALEPSHGSGVVHPIAWEHLEGHWLLKLEMKCLVDFAHAAAFEELVDAKLAEGVARRKERRSGGLVGAGR